MVPEKSHSARRRRQSIPLATQRLVLHEAGFKCANPACRTILTLDIHHIEYVSEGGGNKPDNLLPLCPNCHALHHKGEIPLESVRAWKMFLLTLNEAFDRKSVDYLLMLDKVGWLALSGDGMLACSALVAAGFLQYTCEQHVSAGALHVLYRIMLTDKARLFIEAWKVGDQSKAIL